MWVLPCRKFTSWLDPSISICIQLPLECPCWRVWWNRVKEICYPYDGTGFGHGHKRNAVDDFSRRVCWFKANLPVDDHFTSAASSGAFGSWRQALRPQRESLKIFSKGEVSWLAAGPCCSYLFISVQPRVIVPKDAEVSPQSCGRAMQSLHLTRLVVWCWFGCPSVFIEVSCVTHPSRSSSQSLLRWSVRSEGEG